MPETPIQTTGVIRELLGGTVFRVELPNGKPIVGYLPRKRAELAPSLPPGTQVRLEMTPYDFEKARIAGLADRDHE
jgi:translation initiation factor IF-1